MRPGRPSAPLPQFEETAGACAVLGSPRSVGDEGTVRIVSDAAVVPREVTQERLARGYARIMGYRRDQPYSVADLLEERAVDAGERPFFIFEGRSVTFAQMNALANRVAHAVLAAGFAPGSVVALMMDNRPEFPMVWLGLAKIGVVTALINTSARGAVLRHALEQTQATGLIYGEECAEWITALSGDLPRHVWRLGAGEGAAAVAAGTLDEAMARADATNPPRAQRAGVRLGDPLYLIFTSGTTGLPKAARMSHLRFLNAGGVIAGLLSLGREDVLYNVLPLYHGAGGMVVVSAALHVGIPIVQRRRFSASEFWPDVRRHRVTAWYYIGELCRYLLNQPARADDRDHTLRRMSGAGLKPDVWQRFQERFGIEQICEGLGSTEANYGLTNVDNRVGSVGRLPYPERSNIRVVRYDVERGEHVRGLDGTLRLCTPGEVGELIAEVLDGPGAAGYFEGYTSAEATEAKQMRDVFRPGDRWVRSGDLVRFDSEDYFYFVDRVGDTFRWKGENVSTDEVAAILGQFPGPQIVNVYGVRVPGNEGRAGMVALTYADAGNFDPAGFHRFAAAHLADYAVPLFVRLSPSADLTTTFKLRKLELQRAGYDPERIGEPLYVRDARAGCYRPLTPAALAALGIAPFIAD
ncbi:MAG: long-chain-acyl-CoA synthetase [Proteobacteria bacterium]|nr:long-chain-acyl-CoA synthetase [Pseudomonadota bacterium]